MASYPASNTSPPGAAHEREPGSDFFLKLAAVLLVLAVSALVVFSVLVGQGDDDTAAATSGSAQAATTHDHAAAADSNVSLPLQSFAGKTGANAEELAKAHPAYDATLPRGPGG